MRTVIAFPIILALLFASSVKSQETDSSYRIMSGLGYGISFHGGNFAGIPSVQTCCAKYQDSQGNAAEFSLGLTMPKALKKDKISFQPGAFLSIQQFNAPFSSREFVGNFISGNTVTPATIDFSLNLSGMLIGIEPKIAIHYSDIPISLFAGISASTFLTSNANQTEELIEPMNAQFKNGSTIQNTYDGVITKLRTFMFSAQIGLEHLHHLNSGIALHPSISYRRFLQTPITDHPWEMNSLMLGLGISYALPKAAEPLPPPPIQEEPPIVLTMHFHALLEEGMVEFGDTIPYPYERLIEMTTTSIAPLYLFEKNSGIIVKEQSHNEVILAQSLKDNTTPIRIIAFESETEPKNTALKRAQTVQQRLSGSGANREFIIQTRTVKSGTLRYPELYDEARMVLVSFSDGTLPMHVIRDTQYVFQNTSLRFLSEPSITGANIAGIVTLGTAKTMSIEEPDITFTLSPHPVYPLEVQKLTAQSFASLEPNIRTKGRIELYARPVLLREKNQMSLQSESNTDFILGYSNFDESDFTLIDQYVVNRIVEASKAGKSIILTPLIDDLGSSNHNSSLADKRLQSAISLLSKVLDKEAMENITTATARMYKADGGSLGRVLHRGIAVTIGK